MRHPKTRHHWDLTPAEAIKLQKRMASQVSHQALRADPRLIAGGDVAFNSDGTQMVAGWIVWDLKTREIVERGQDVRDLSFPYIPGLLSFREAPALLGAAGKLTNEPDVFMFDGQGLAHPRRFGLACHVGLLMNRPSLGCAKSRLCGEHSEPGKRAGSSRRLMEGREIIGRVVRTRDGVKPVYVSVGHRMSLDDAVRLTLRCCDGYRIPAPTRLAHQFVTGLRREL